MLITHYTILGINETATLDEVKKAYRTKCLIYHPDKNNGSADSAGVFVRIQKAYDALSNPQLRLKYDIDLHNYRARISKESQQQKWTVPPSTYRPSPPPPKPQQQRENVKPKQERSPQYRSMVLRLYGLIGILALLIVLGSFYFGSVLKEKETLTNPIIDTISNKIDTIPNKVDYTDVPADTQKPKEKISLTTGSRPYRHYYGRGLFDKESLSSVTIKNGNESDAIVILKNISSGSVIRHVYIKANDRYVFKQMPEGVFKMRVLYGNNWNHEMKIADDAPVGGFERDVSCSEMDNRADYINTNKTETVDGYSYPTYEITLYTVNYGNMSTQKIPPATFFN